MVYALIVLLCNPPTDRATQFRKSLPEVSLIGVSDTGRYGMRREGRFLSERSLKKSPEIECFGDCLCPRFSPQMTSA
jgi:hypothetical protein